MVFLVHLVQRVPMVFLVHLVTQAQPELLEIMVRMVSLASKGSLVTKDQKVLQDLVGPEVNPGHQEGTAQMAAMVKTVPMEHQALMVPLELQGIPVSAEIKVPLVLMV